jgi:phage recombination protein Bet
LRYTTYKNNLNKEGVMNQIAEIKPQETNITKADVRKYICEKATDKEIDLFLITCKLHGLNPFKREAYLIKYGSSPAQTVVGYETYLKRAEATGQLDGWECTADEQSATIIIWRKDREHPFKWTIDRAEFDKKVAMWNVMPLHMLKKTVISVGFRLCFPETLGGMPYTKEVPKQ